MQVLPDQRNGRLTAVLLLLIVLILVYMLGFHWFFQRHADYAGQIGDLRLQLARFEAVAAQREPLQQQLASIRASRQDEGLFLQEDNFNEAAAAMADRLGQMVEAEAGENCQIVSRQPVRPRVEERFERVTVNVRMRCYAEDLLQILYRLETEPPQVLIDELNVLRPRARRGRNGEQPSLQPLDIRFNMSGYLKQ